MRLFILLILLSNIAICGPKIERKVIAQAKKYKISKYLLLALGMVESSLRPRAMGDGGQSYGIFQIKCTTAIDLGFRVPCKKLLRISINARFANKQNALYIKHSFIC